MGKTYKKQFPRGWYRNVSGRKNGLIAGTKNTKLPPDRWDEIPLDKECRKIYKVSLALHKKGIIVSEIVQHLMKKFNCSYGTVSDIIECEWWGGWLLGCDCSECKKNRAK